jgi:hypothetical protein
VRASTRLTSVAAVAVAAVLSGPAWAARASQVGATHAVFVQTNDPQRQFHRGVPAEFRRDADTRRHLPDGRHWREDD